MSKLLTVVHPLISHSLTILRDSGTRTDEFRRHSSIVSKILLVEATKHLMVVPQRINTPLAAMDGWKLGDDVIVVPVLRAGLAMLLAMQDFLPAAAVGFVGLQRDEETAQAHEYYKKLPSIFSASKVIVIDPMLATGGSFDETATALKEKGATDITFVCIVAAPEGIAHIHRRHPDVMIITAAVDECLNAKKFIVPGLGDFGDRFFGT